MKYTEFKAEVENMGFVVIDSGAPIYVRKDKDGETIMSIYVHSRFRLDPGWRGFSKLTEDQQLKVYDLACQLAKTPLAEREEEKRYWLRLDVPAMSSKQAWSVYYLNKHKEAKMYRLGSDAASISWQTIFTESEIAEMDITGFEKVEVTE